MHPEDPTPASLQQGDRGVAAARVVAVTGATGFVGRHLVGALRAAEDAAAADAGVGGRGRVRVRCLVRDPGKAERIDALRGADCVRGSLEDTEALGRLVDGVDAVVHVAGATRALSRRGFFAANAAGTERLVDAVLASRRDDGSAPPRFVLVSSLAAAGPDTDGRDSACSPLEARPCSDYGASKRAAELLLLAQDPARLDWIVLRPPVVYGAQDEATDVMLRQAAAPVLVVPPRAAPLSVVHVDDVVDAVLRACDPGRRLPDRVRDRFVPLDGPERSDAVALLRSMAAAQGCRPGRPVLRVPGAALRLAGWCADVAAQVRRRPGYFGGDKVRDLLAGGWVASAEPGERVLGFRSRIGLEAGLAQVVAAVRDAATSAAGTPSAGTLSREGG